MMKRTIRRKVVPCVSGMLLALPGHSVEIDVGASVLVTFRQQDQKAKITSTGDKSSLNSNYYDGLAYLNFVTSAVSGSVMHEAKAVLMPTLQGSFGIDELSYKFGEERSWDVTLGYFEPWDLYNKGDDDLVSLTFGDTSVYKAKLVGEKVGSLMGQGHFGQVSTQLYVSQTREEIPLGEEQVHTNVTGIRPAVRYDDGMFSATVGAEMLQSASATSPGPKGELLPKSMGFGATLGYDAQMFAGSLSYANYSNEVKDAKDTQTSTGIMLTYRYESVGDFGLDYHMTQISNGESAEAKMNTDLSMAALRYTYPIEQGSELLVAVTQSMLVQKDAGTKTFESTGTGFAIGFRQAI